MLARKNKLMLLFSAGTTVLSLLVHLLHRRLDLFSSMSMPGHMMSAETAPAWQINLLLAVPIVFSVWGWLRYRRKQEHPLIPLLNVLALAFSSISMIAGGGGAVEFHFSIFMVVAMAAYYDSVKLMLVMTLVFAVHHLAGYFFVPELVFGASRYSFLMVSVHAIFLILTSAATSYQIVSKTRMRLQLEAETQAKQDQIEALLHNVQELSIQLQGASVVVSERSELTSRNGEEMVASYREVSTALEHQSMSIRSAETDIQQTTLAIREVASASERMQASSIQSDESIGTILDRLESLARETESTYRSIEAAYQAVNKLTDSALSVEEIVAAIQDISGQIHLLGLNAAIEAARAGEHGQGFAVVASEVRKLAVQSSQSSERIREIIASIQEDSRQAWNGFETGLRSADETKLQAESTLQGFQEVRSVLQATSSSVREVHDALIRARRSIDRISSEMLQIASVTEQNVSSMEELYHITEAQTDSTREINDEVSRLKQLSDSLQNQFG